MLQHAVGILQLVAILQQAYLQLAARGIAAVQVVLLVVRRLLGCTRGRVSGQRWMGWGWTARLSAGAVSVRCSCQVRFGKGWGRGANGRLEC
jgi:hypothetical protein